jgi:tetratricopeptide (TPR) repeat protein
MSATPEPIATGTLARTPLPHLLVYLEQKKLSGTLALWPDPQPGEEPKGQDRILLLKGVPMAGRLLEPTTVLRAGLLKLFARERAPYAFYEVNLLGDDRVSGRVDPLSLIAESLRERARADAVEAVLARIGDATLRMLPGVDVTRYELQPEERALVDALRSQPCDVPTLITVSGLPEERARRLVYLLTITKAVAPLETTPAQARQSHAEEAQQAAQPEAEEADQQTDDAADDTDSQRPAPEVGMHVDAVAQAAAAATPEVDESSFHTNIDRLQSIPPPPDDLSEELRTRWLKVVTKGRLMENQNYFEMLDIDREAKSNDARSKFYQLAKDWHPDRLPAPLAPLREYVQVIFGYMSEAANTLGDEAQRTKYVQTVREGGGTPATDKLMQTILDTAMEYERVLVMARRRDYDTALELMIRILQIQRDDPEYNAMYAWLLMQKFPGQEAPLQKMLDAVDKALSAHDRHERANLLKAQILRRMGRQDDALEYFQKVAEINPRNVDAMREVRVATMRSHQAGPATSKSAGKPGSKGKKGKKEAESGVGGLLGKMFGKK